MAANTEMDNGTPDGGDTVAGTDTENSAPIAASEHARHEQPAGTIPPTSEATNNAEKSANLETVLRRIVEHIETTDRSHSEALTDLRERIVSLGQQTQAARQGNTNLNSEELNQLEHQVKHLSQCITSAEQARSENETRQKLEKRISGLNDESSEKTGSGAEAAPGIAADDSSGQISIAELAKDLNADITFTVTEGPGSQTDEAAGINEPGRSIAAERQVVPDDVEADQETIMALTDMYAVEFVSSRDAEEEGSDQGWLAFEKATSSSEPKSKSPNYLPADPVVETAHRPTSTRNHKNKQEERFAQVAVALKDTMHKKKTARQDQDAIRACFDDLSARVESILRSRVKEFSLEPIERQVAEISAYVAKTEQHFGKISTVETKLLQLIELVENTQTNIAASTSEALDTAATRLEKTINKSTPSERLQVIQKSIESLAEKGRTTEVQTVDTLETINDTLSKMVDRLQSVEKTGIATKAELKAIRLSTDAARMGGAGDKAKGASPVRNGTTPKSRPAPRNIEIQKPVKPERKMPSEEIGNATQKAESKTENRAVQSTDFPDSVRLSGTRISPAEAEPAASDGPNKARSVVFPTGGMSRKEDFISAARRAALQESANADQSAEGLKDESDSQPADEERHTPASLARDMKSKLGSLVRSLPRPPFVILAIAAFTASAAILIAERYLNAFIAHDEAIVGRYSAEDGIRNRQFSMPRAPTSIAKTVRVTASTPAAVKSDRQSDRLAALNLTRKSHADKVAKDIPSLKGSQQFADIKDTETKSGISNRHSGPIVNDPGRNGTQTSQVKSTGNIVASIPKIETKLAADRTDRVPRTGNSVNLPELKEIGQKPNARPTEKPSLSLPPTTIGSLALRRAAANGNGAAQYQVALRYAEGKKIKQDYAEAATWFKRAAARGYAPAEYRIGTLLERGLGLTRDLGRAQIWYRRAAENGNVKAMHNLAVLYTKGPTAAPDYVQAAEWFRKAAAYGLADSQFNLAVLLETGLGVEKDLMESYKWFSLASARGDKEAARKRAALENQLAEDSRRLADSATRNWRAQSINHAANFAAAPIDGWENAPPNSNLLSAKELPKRLVANKS